MANTKLALKCAQGKFEKSTKVIKDVAQVYQVDSGNKILYYWNSSNNQKINHKDVLLKISEELEDDSDGRVYDDFNEIMFEVE